jgi:hypothetical protein
VTRSLPPSIYELETRLGLSEDTLEGEDKARAEAALEDATTLALAEVSDSKATVWQSNAPGVVALVILKAARREYDNPEGFAQESLADHSVTLGESSGVYLTGREIAQIKRAATGRRGFTGTTRTPSAYSVPRTPHPLAGHPLL